MGIHINLNEKVTIARPTTREKSGGGGGGTVNGLSKDEQGNLTIDTSPSFGESIMVFQSPNGVNWEVKVDDIGTLKTITTTKPVSELIGFRKPDTSLYQVTVSNLGELETSPMPMGLTPAQEASDMYLLSDSGFYWTLKLNQAGAIVTQDSSASFTYTNDIGSPLFKVQKIAVDRGILYMNHFDPTELPTAGEIPVVANSSAYAFRRDDSGNLVMVFWDVDDELWKPVASKTDNVIYLGDPTVDGSWRIMLSGANLVHQRLESSSWVTKQTVSA